MVKEKYKFVKNDTMEVDGVTLTRIISVRAFANINKNQLGGYIEKESNLSHLGTCWVHSYAKAMGNSKVQESAQLWGKAIISGNAVITDKSLLCNNAIVTDNTILEGKVLVGGDSIIGGNVKIRGGARILDNVKLSGDIFINNNVTLIGNFELSNQIPFCDNAVITTSDIKAHEVYLSDGIPPVTIYTKMDGSKRFTCVGIMDKTKEEFLEDIHNTKWILTKEQIDHISEAMSKY